MVPMRPAGTRTRYVVVRLTDVVATFWRPICGVRAADLTVRDRACASTSVGLTAVGRRCVPRGSGRGRGPDHVSGRLCRTGLPSKACVCVYFVPCLLCGVYYYSR